MASFDREQLEALKRQIEDDYRLDMAAIERLQRRMVPSSSPIAAVSAIRETPAAERGKETPTGERVRDTPTGERNVTVLPSLESQGEAQPDDLTNTLRGMFSSHRR